MIHYHDSQVERVNAALPASQAQLAAASERADAQLAEVSLLLLLFIVVFIDILFLLLFLLLSFFIVVFIVGQ